MMTNRRMQLAGWFVWAVAAFMLAFGASYGCQQSREAAATFVGAPMPSEIDASRANYRLALERLGEAERRLADLPADATPAERKAAEGAVASAEGDYAKATEQALAVQSETVAAVERLKAGGAVVGDGIGLASPEAGAVWRLVANYGAEALLALLLGGAAIRENRVKRRAMVERDGARHVLETTERIGFANIATKPEAKAAARLAVQLEPRAHAELERVRAKVAKSLANAVS